MRNTFFAVVIALALFGTPAFSKTFKLPNDEFAFASVSFPEDWEPSEIDNGVEGQSPDSAVYLAAVAVGTDKGAQAELDDTFAFLEKHKVIPQKDSEHENKFDLHGIEVHELVFKAKDEDGPCTVSISFIPIKDKMIVLTYWVTTEKEKEHQAEVGKILQSIKASS
jgi:hypothetical protein